jgi:hypothetical protein
MKMAIPMILRIFVVLAVATGFCAAQPQTTKLTTIYSSSHEDNNPIIAGPGGVLYGSNFAQPEIVYSLTPPSSPSGSWTETTLFTFAGPHSTAGGDPTGPLAVGPNGIVYGTTRWGGGNCACGTVYALRPPEQDRGEVENGFCLHTRSLAGDVQTRALTIRSSPGPSSCIDTRGLSSWMHANCL